MNYKVLSLTDSIRPLEKKDLDIILKWRNDDSIRHFMFNRNIITYSEHLAWYEALILRNDRHALAFEKDGELKGFAQLSEIKGGVAEWGFYINPESVPGTGKYLAYNVIDYAFNILDLHKISARVIDYNQRSIFLHQKIGFKQEGKLIEEHFDGEEYHHVICFGLLKKDWTERIKND